MRRHHLHSGAGGFFYLVALMDWARRFVLSWELDNTMEVGFCVSAGRAAHLPIAAG